MIESIKREMELQSTSRIIYILLRYKNAKVRTKKLHMGRIVTMLTEDAYWYSLWAT